MAKLAPPVGFDDVPKDRAPESVLALVALVPDAFELFKVVLGEAWAFRGR
jgi:hypothetical protein